MKNGIYGFHYEGQYLEGLFKSNNLLELYVDYFKSEIELKIDLIDLKKVRLFKYIEF